jgi:hypothetical protein
MPESLKIFIISLFFKKKKKKKHRGVWCLESQVYEHKNLIGYKLINAKQNMKYCKIFNN